METSSEAEFVDQGGSGLVIDLQTEATRTRGRSAVVCPDRDNWVIVIFPPVMNGIF